MLSDNAIRRNNKKTFKPNLKTMILTYLHFITLFIGFIIALNIGRSGQMWYNGITI